MKCSPFNRVFEPFEILPDIEEAKALYCLLDLDTDIGSCFALVNPSQVARVNDNAGMTDHNLKFVPGGEA
jgi:hypothetical protein